MTARWQRVPELAGIKWRDDALAAKVQQQPHESGARHDFANLVVRQLTTPAIRIAVINDRGRPALIRCTELLFDLLAKDHPIVGVYAPGAKVRDVIDDLKAAGL